MKVISKAITNGIIEDKYGKRGNDFAYGMPSRSIPIQILDAPKNTVSYALVLEDKDAVEVCGFVWIHWVACNITSSALAENSSQEGATFVQGINSWISPLGGSLERSQCSCYGGMAPPNAPHNYELHVYALDCMLELQSGFGYNHLWRAMQGHILDSTTIVGKYDN